MAAIANFAGLPLAGLTHAGLPLNAGLINAGLPLNAYGLHHPGLFHGALPAQAPLVQGALPTQYVQAAAAPLVQAAAPIVQAAPVVPRQYAVPPARLVQHAPAVETIHEKVEQHGYKIKY